MVIRVKGELMKDIEEFRNTMQLPRARRKFSGMRKMWSPTNEIKMQLGISWMPFLDMAQQGQQNLDPVRQCIVNGICEIYLLMQWFSFKRQSVRSLACYDRHFWLGWTMTTIQHLFQAQNLWVYDEKFVPLVEIWKKKIEGSAVLLFWLSWKHSIMLRRSKCLKSFFTFY